MTVAISLKQALARITLAVTIAATASFSQGLSARDGIGSSGADVIEVSDSMIDLEISKGKLIRLSRPAVDVFIANPNVANVQVKSDRILYVYGINAGETSIFALDDKDEIIYTSQINVVRNLDAVNETLVRLLPDRSIHLRMINETMIVMSGIVASPDESATAESIVLGALGQGGQVINRLEITQPTQVNLRVRMAEISRSVVKELGFNWEGGFFRNDWGIGLQSGRNIADLVEDPITGNPIKVFEYGDVPSLFGDVDIGGNFNIDLNYAIDALDQQGFINILAEPNLTAQTGESADFLAGGEFPVPFVTRDGVTVNYREFGVRLAFTPTVLDTGRISIQVAPEVSQLSPVGAVEIDGFSIPATTTRRAQTTVNLGSGQSFAIAGLLQNSIQDDSTKIPGLGDIPILGALFKSDAFRRNETELLIVVTPYAVRPISDRQISLPTDGYIAPSDMDRFLKGKQWQPNLNDQSGAQDAAKGPSRKNRAGFQLN